MSPPTSALADMGDPLEPGPFAGIDAPTTRDYCAWALHADALFKRWMELARTPAENEAYLVRLQPTWEQMRLVAPGDLDSRFDIVTPTYEFIWESLADSGFDLEVHHAEHGDDILALRDQTFLAAAHTIDTYGYDTCGVTPP